MDASGARRIRPYLPGLLVGALALFAVLPAGCANQCAYVEAELRYKDLQLDRLEACIAERDRQITKLGAQIDQLAEENAPTRQPLPELPQTPTTDGESKVEARQAGPRVLLPR